MLPSLTQYRHVSLDIETHDPDLKKYGPGARRPDSYILGIAMTVSDKSFYIPIAHPDSENWPPYVVKEYLKRELRGKIIIGANILYDLDWLCQRGYIIDIKNNKFYDVLIAEHLLNEELKVDLDAICKFRLGIGKSTQTIDEVGRKINPKKPAIQLLNQMPARVVAPYGIMDSQGAFLLYFKQQPLLEKEDLLEVMDFENRLIPLLLAMRLKGVKIDTEKVDIIRPQMQANHKELLSEIPFNPNSTKQMGAWLLQNGLSVEYTEKGNPSVTKDWLEANQNDHPIIEKVLRARVLSKLLSTYIINMFENYVINDRIHTNFKQVGTYDGGTRSGRFSSAHPNLQNIPARDKSYAKLIREIFIPEEGQYWQRFDYSQIEYRLLVYYSFGPGSQEVKEAFRNDPTTDFHQKCMDMIKQHTGIDLDRKRAKTMNFGMVYGMGQQKLKKSLGIEDKIATKMLTAYHTANPYIKLLYNKADTIARNRGYIKMLGGRKRRFPYYLGEDGGTTMDHRKAGEYAEDWFMNAKNLRTNTHKALNSLLQGGAAEVMKRAMVLLWEGGICDEDIGLGVPMLTIHDELDFSVSYSNKPVAEEAKRIMENAIKINIPLLVDSSSGSNWGEAD